MQSVICLSMIHIQPILLRSWSLALLWFMACKDQTDEGGKRGGIGWGEGEQWWRARSNLTLNHAIFVLHTIIHNCTIMHPARWIEIAFEWEQCRLVILLPSYLKIWKDKSTRPFTVDYGKKSYTNFHSNFFRASI